MRTVLDANAYSALMRGSTAVAELIRRAERVYLSAVVAVELLLVTYTTADRFGLICNSLRRNGTPIPPNDISIAAHALETGADLVSFDGHFSSIEGLAFLHVREP